MPRDQQHGPRPGDGYLEHRNPRKSTRPHDDDVRIDRRDHELCRDLRSVTNRMGGHAGGALPERD